MSLEPTSDLSSENLESLTLKGQQIHPTPEGVGFLCDLCKIPNHTYNQQRLDVVL